MLESTLHLFIFGLTCIGKQVLTVGERAHQLSRHFTYEIITPQRLTAREKHWIHLHKEHLDNQLSYLIQTGNGMHILKLTKNKNLIGENFLIYTYSTEGKLETSPLEAKAQCYYHGFVEGISDSLLAFSTCDGLRGILHIGGKRYGMEPVDGSKQFEHFFYPLENSHQDSFLCGVPNDDPFLKYTNVSHIPFRKDALLRRRRAVLPQKSYVELYVVVDHNRYLRKMSDVAAVQKETVELANYVDGVSEMENAHPSWKVSCMKRYGPRDATDKIWRTDIQSIGRNAFNGTVGMAFVGTVCNPGTGGSISTFNHDSVIHQATIVAHELGHNMGMNHDDGKCPNSFIMYSTDNGSKNFSSCSSNDFENLILRGGGRCLRNAPKPSEVYTEPVCGNNVVDKNEECDCGTPKECTSPCCDAATCKLKSGSECAEGMCCENCKFKVAGSECRQKTNACDLPEYCNGTKPDCPEDVYIMNGYPCHNMKDYCYNGVCQNYDAQCESLFGKGARKAPDVCFEAANSKGDRFGNCGMSGSNFVRCSQANSLCGKLHCTSFSYQNLPFQVFIQNQNGNKCVTTDFDLGSDITDPALVQKGTACKEGKACVNFKCVNASELDYKCDVKKKCNGRAVCNNRGNCHCDPGWAPPFCSQSGYGGSIDSGPTHIDTSLRDGLLVFFLLVLPVLILVLIAFIKRDALERRLCRECRRRRRVKYAQRTRQKNTPSGPNQPNAVNKKQHAISNSGIFVVSHAPAPRPPVPSDCSSPPRRPPVRPPIPLRPIVQKMP